MIWSHHGRNRYAPPRRFGRSVLQRVSCRFDTIISQLAIISDSDIRSLTVYRFIILLAACDIVGASIHCVTGFALIFPSFWSITLGNFLGSVLIPSYFCYILTEFLLSFVRFVQILYPNCAEILFSPKRGKGNINGDSAHRERRLMYQTFFATAYATCLNFTSHNIGWINKGRLPVVYAACTYFWLLNTAVYPLTFIVMNRTMRQKIISSLRFTRLTPKKLVTTTLKVMPSSRSLA
ncbi:hypothetical protein RB195_000494 [Necator americanus]|uniref:7TM GPCR serpentine receptor class x (Srx) domain-containing protein n=1 Tax=Necator americanus TaxID=51031 RepID=A0ABR1DBG2_NECAM